VGPFGISTKVLVTNPPLWLFGVSPLGVELEKWQVMDHFGPEI
jgi:hypothetical protein